jgi:very-short-patch-repair endonuclease
MLAIEIDGISHDFKYENDLRWQGELENLGVHFIRFDDQEVKNNMFSVLLELQQKIEELEK